MKIKITNEKAEKGKTAKAKVTKSKAKSNVIQFELIVTITNRGYSDFVVEAARNAGASGGTIINGRGTGIHEKESILGVSIQPEKEMVLTLVKKEEKSKIMKAIVEGANLNKEGKGICFSMPVEDVAGINHFLNGSEEVEFAEEQKLEQEKVKKAEQKSNVKTESSIKKVADKKKKG